MPFLKRGFALRRRFCYLMPSCAGKSTRISCVGVFNYDGAEEYYREMIKLAGQVRTCACASLLMTKPRGVQARSAWQIKFAAGDFDESHGGAPPT